MVKRCNRKCFRIIAILTLQQTCVTLRRGGRGSVDILRVDRRSEGNGVGVGFGRVLDGAHRRTRAGAPVEIRALFYEALGMGGGGGGGGGGEGGGVKGETTTR